MALSLDDTRRASAEEIRAFSGIRGEALIDALARVPREDFLGPGPWLCASRHRQLLAEEPHLRYQASSRDVRPLEFQRPFMSDDMFRCPQCAGVYDYSVSQYFDDEVPKWGASGGCRGCEDRIQIDGYGLPPPEFRSLIFAEEGARELTIEPGADAVSTLRQLQTILNIPSKSLAPLAKQVPGSVLWGTQTEMNWLASALGARGTTASVSAKDPSTDSGSLDLDDLLPKGWHPTGASSPTSPP